MGRLAATYDGTVIGRDGQVMTQIPRRASLRDMSTDYSIAVLVLEEFKLSSGDSHSEAARIVEGSRRGQEPSVPLLTSIDDRTDVALLRGLHAGESVEPDAMQHAALDELVSSWQPPKHYGPRITERSESPPTYYRLAVTESGINDPEHAAGIRGAVRLDAASTAIGLLWIGQPVGTHAGLLVLLGSHEDAGATPRTGDWPLPLSRRLGVRIYESAA